MIRTRVYYPTNAEEFRKNIWKRWYDHSEEIGHYNSKDSLSKRTDDVLIYHVLDATVFIHAPSDDNGRVNITVNVRSVPGGIESAKSLLEKISEVKLIEKR